MRIIILNNDMLSFVDNEDYAELNKYKWYAWKHRNTYYAIRRSSIKNLNRMHRFIMNPPDNMQVDHINGNGLDNRKENLRIVTNRENGQNKHVKTSSKYPGVYWNKRDRNWQSMIVINGKKKFICCSKNEIDAATAYRVACVYLTGKDPIELKS